PLPHPPLDDRHVPPPLPGTRHRLQDHSLLPGTSSTPSRSCFTHIYVSFYFLHARIPNPVESPISYPLTMMKVRFPLSIFFAIIVSSIIAPRLTSSSCTSISPQKKN